MRIVYITAGAAGMYCGSCLRDNTLATALAAQGHEALLVPTYTPITTDEVDVSQKRVFFGGINVYLQQKFGIFRHTPWFLDRLFDGRRLLRWVSRFAVRTRAEDLGELTVSMLEGENGKQKKEIAKIVDWLAGEIRPEVINLSNVLLGGMAGKLKSRLGVPIVGSLQGDDIYLEALPEPHKSRCLALVREHCQDFAGFIATSHYYADFMAGYLDISREKIHVVHPGINLHGHGSQLPAQIGKPFTVGYFARICPEKGLHVLVDAFARLQRMPGMESAQLHVSGWLGENYKKYLAGLGGRVAGNAMVHKESPDHASKVRFLQELDVLSVPTIYREPKGLYVLEALANGVPVVQPRHGSFPELIEMTGGGLLVNPDDPDDLARGLYALATDGVHREELGRRGKAAIHGRFQAHRMAEDTVSVYRQYLR
jgi:glycosyltransferase involved in cell wall biosynthesis